MSDYGEKEVIFHSFSAKDNIVPIGEDFQKGECLIKKGAKLDAQAIACMAATGMQIAKVYHKVRVSVGKQEAIKEYQFFAYQEIRLQQPVYSNC